MDQFPGWLQTLEGNSPIPLGFFNLSLLIELCLQQYKKFEVSLHFLENFRTFMYNFCKAIYCQPCCHVQYYCQVLVKNILQPILQISWAFLQRYQIITVQYSCLCVSHASDMRTSFTLPYMMFDIKKWWLLLKGIN